jgi:short-subunit dehydrogenase
VDIGGKVVIITGASSGIGRELARQLAAKGAKLALLARREEALNACAAEECAGAETLVVPADVTRPEQCASAVAATFAHFGRVDVLVNCAGLGYFGPIETMRIADFDRVVRTNVYGLLYMTQSALPYLKQSHGMIVNVSSALSKRALPFLAAYGGTKALVDQLSDGLRMELRPYGVHVLAYNPPETETEFAASSIRAAGMERAREGGRKRKPVGQVVARMVRAMEAEKRDVVEGRALQWMGLLMPRRTDAMFCRAMVEPMLAEAGERHDGEGDGEQPPPAGARPQHGS